MRVASGRGNDARKILTYYRANFGLSPPFRVLCDGALIHLTLQRRLYLRDTLAGLLGSPTQAVVTRCIVEELRGLGDSVSGAAIFAKRLTRVPCRHGGTVIPAVDCIAHAVASGNPNHLFIASNDSDLMKAVSLVLFLPQIKLVNQTRLVLMPPKQATREAVAVMQKEKTGIRRPDEVRILAVQEVARLAKRIGSSERRARHRKRPKGPNPLSVKKSKSAVDQHSNVSTSDEAAKLVSKTVTTRKGSSPSTHAVRAVMPVILKPKRVRNRKPKSKSEEALPSKNTVVCSVGGSGRNEGGAV